MDLFDIIVRAIVLMTAIPIHEAAHAYVADKLGDPTAKYMGRLTINPMAHFDLIGSLAMIFTGIGWAKPVPINPRNFKDQNGYSFPMISDHIGLSAGFNVSAYPTTVFIDSSGRIIAIDVGAYPSQQALENRINSLLK